MTVHLDQPDFQRLTRIVQNLPDFATEVLHFWVRGRRVLPINVFFQSESKRAVSAYTY